MDCRQSLQPRLRPGRRSLPRQNRRRHAIPREGHPGRRRLGVHGRVRGRLSDKGHRSLRPAAAKPANERRRRTLQRRLAIRVLRNLRPPVRRRTTQPHPRQLSAPLQPSSTPRSPCRKNPSPVSGSPISQDTHAVPYVLSPDTRLTADRSRRICPPKRETPLVNLCKFLSFPLAALALVAAGPASADLRMCNNTGNRVSVALAYTDGQGW